MDLNETTVVDTKSIVDENTRKELMSIYEDIKEREYEAEKKIVAYLVSGDNGYISSYKECRNRISKFNREDMIEVMLVNFINK